MTADRQQLVTRSAPRAFYVTARDGRGRTLYLLGPFARHTRALGLVTCVRLLMSRAGLDPFHSIGYGTASLPLRPETLPRGTLAELLHCGPDVPARGRSRSNSRRRLSTVCVPS